MSAVHDPIDLAMEPAVQFVIQRPGREYGRDDDAPTTSRPDAWSVNQLQHELAWRARGTRLDARPAIAVCGLRGLATCTPRDTFSGTDLEWWRTGCGIHRNCAFSRATKPAAAPGEGDAQGSSHLSSGMPSCRAAYSSSRGATELTVYVTLLAAMAALLRKHTGPWDVISEALWDPRASRVRECGRPVRQPARTAVRYCGMILRFGCRAASANGVAGGSRAS